MEEVAARLRRVIEDEINRHPHYNSISPSDVATDLIPVIMDELESELEFAWMYEDLRNS